jgi:hypothetical protein
MLRQEKSGNPVLKSIFIAFNLSKIRNGRRLLSKVVFFLLPAAVNRNDQKLILKKTIRTKKMFILMFGKI